MMTFISCAKTMTDRTATSVPFSTLPPFQAQAEQTAMELLHYSSDELARLLRVNPKLAAGNYLRYQEFLSPETKALPALLSYTGMVFKHICPKDFTADDFSYAQQHLLITSFLYGLLRPLDAIKNYRLEGDVKLPERDGQTMFEWWKPLLTDWFIEAIRRQGGILVNLASGEMRHLFDWKRVETSVRVVTPEFLVDKNGRFTTVVVYAKMCRGEMTRFILKQRIAHPDALKAFRWEGFAYNASMSTPDHPVFTL